jgi:hypothetical protein
MRILLSSLAAGILLLAGAGLGLAQTSAAPEPGSSSGLPPPTPPGANATGLVSLGAPLAASPPIRGRLRVRQQADPPPESMPAASPPSLGEQQALCVKELGNLLKEEAALQGAATQDDEQKKKIELLQKQIVILEKQLKLLADQLKKLQATGPAVEKLEFQAATLESRGLQAARRDVELAEAVGDLREHIDSQERYGPQLPAPLKELFLPSGTSETPLSIYGALAFGYSKILGNSTTSAAGATGPRPSTPGAFYFGEFTPDFFLKLNDWILLEAEIAAGSDGSVSLGGFAQADFFVNDWLTIIAGRFVAPIGWYNLRSNNPWVTKTPTDAPGSAPLLWQQVLPLVSLLGVQATGSFYLGCTPIKMEYSGYVSNGLNITPATARSPTIDELANLENMTNTFASITNEKVVGGRIGFWWPEKGLEAGFSALYNGDYIAGGFENSLSLFAVDLNYRMGNWDVRAEYGRTYQQTRPFFPTDITRQGVHFQVAYRPYDCPHKILQNFEAVYRYGYVDFQGIEPSALDLTKYATPIDVPVRRHQHQIGVNYYFYPRLVLKCAYQFNEEPGFHLHDNQFITELAWGW